MDRARLQAILEELTTDRQETVDALLAMTEERYGMVPLVLKVLTRLPEVAIPSSLKTQAIFADGSLDRKTTELLAVAAATALRCEHCLLVHAEQALANHASTEEVFQAILVASSIAESASWAIAFRVLNRIEEKLAKQRPGATGR